MQNLNNEKILFFDLGGVIFRDIFSGGESVFLDGLGIDKEKFINIYTETDLPLYSKGKISDNHRWKLFAEKSKINELDVEYLVKLYISSYSPIEETVDFLKEIKKNYSLGVL